MRCFSFFLLLAKGSSAVRVAEPASTIALAPADNSTVECGEACTCPNRCSGNGECFNGQCKCFPGYTYFDCSLRVCPSDCSNNGFCYNATCHCNPGWKGGDCSIQTCPDECNYHGSCKAGKCVCRPGWKGDAC